MKVGDVINFFNQMDKDLSEKAYDEHVSSVEEALPDEPTPATTAGEWTRDRIPECLNTTDLADWQQISDAHNAAMQDQQQEIDGLKRANRGLYIESNERFRQLAAAQALAKGNITGCGTCASILSRGTSCLDAVVAEAVKPLVEALEEIIRMDGLNPIWTPTRIAQVALAKHREGK